MFFSIENCIYLKNYLSMPRLHSVDGKQSSEKFRAQLLTFPLSNSWAEARAGIAAPIRPGSGSLRPLKFCLSHKERI